MTPAKAVLADPLALRAWRERRGLTTVELGRRIGRDSSTIRHLERAKKEAPKPASVVLMNQIANALEVDVRELIEGEPAA